MFFVDININGEIKLNNEQYNEQLRNALKFGFRMGMLKGAFVAILALLIFNVWYILPLIGAPDSWAVVLLWIGMGFFPALWFYKPQDPTFSINPAFLIGLTIATGLMNYIYNVLAYDILPYNSLETIIIMVIVLISAATGFMVKIKTLLKETKAKETSQ